MESQPRVEYRDNSQILEYRKCPTSWFFKYVLGLRKVKEDGAEHDKSFGKAFHRGVEFFRKRKPAEECITEFKKQYPLQLDPTDLAKTQPHGVKLLNEYFTRYSDDFDRYEILAVEERLDLKLADETYSVKCDAVVRNKQFGSIYGIDTKTTKKYLDFKYWAQYNPNSQITSQTFAIEQKYGECAGIIIDAVQLGFRQKASKLGPAGFHYSMNRMEFNCSPRQMEIWQASALKSLEEMKRDQEAGKFAMNTGACWNCSFRGICEAAWSWPEDSELILLNYEQSDPFAYLLNDSEQEEQTHVEML